MSKRYWTAALLFAMSTGAMADGPTLPDGGGPAPATEASPVALGAGMTRPGESDACHGKPPAPLGEDGKPLTGVALVSMVVYADGHVGEISLKNPQTPNAPALFVGIERWLQGCRYTPSIKNGKAISVRMTVPFAYHAAK